MVIQCYGCQPLPSTSCDGTFNEHIDHILTNMEVNILTTGQNVVDILTTLLNILITKCLQCFDAVGWEGHPACKKLRGGVLA